MECRKLTSGGIFPLKICPAITPATLDHPFTPITILLVAFHGVFPASHVPRSGPPANTPPSTNSSGSLPGENPAAMTAAIDWVHDNAGKGDWAHIDASRIGTWGQSCGGLEAYAAGLNDSRVSQLGIFNSGELSEQASREFAGNLSKPVFYILGGPSDVAYPNVREALYSP